MSLQTQLTQTLDLSSLTGALGSQLGQSSAALEVVQAPVDGDATEAARSQAASFGADELAQVATFAAETLKAVMGGLPQVDAVLGPLLEALRLVERLTQSEGDGGTLIERLGTLGERLSGPLKAPQGPWLDALLSLADAGEKAPEIAAVLDILRTMGRLAGVGEERWSAPLQDALPAIKGLAQALGGLTGLLSELASAGRTAELLARHLRRDELEALVESARYGLSVDWAARFQALDPADAAAVGQMRALLSRALEDVGRLADRLRGGFAFGEATLAWLDIGAVAERSGRAAAMLRGANLQAVERVAQGVARGLAPLLNVPVDRVPFDSLDALFGHVEGKLAPLVAQVESFDPNALIAPVSQGLDAAASALGTFRAAIESVLAAAQAALAQVQAALAQLPLQAVADRIREAAGKVAEILAQVGSLLGGAQAAIEGAAGAATTALGTVEAALVAFQDAVEAAFRTAAEYVESLNLSAAVGGLVGQVEALAEKLRQVDPSPIFDGANSAINAATGVVEKIPFSLLPDSMERDVENAIRPVKQADVQQFRQKATQAMQITDEGRFAQRAQVEAAIAEVQRRYEKLLEALAGAVDLPGLAAQMNAEMAVVADKVRNLVPALALEPLQEALDTAKAAVASVDLQALLDPLRRGFDEALEAIDRWSPAQLVAPLQARVDEARQTIVDAVRLTRWEPGLDSMVQGALRLVEWADPMRIEPLLEQAVAALQEVLDRAIPESPAGSIGQLVASLLAGVGFEVDAGAFRVVIGWLGAGSGAEVLREQAGRLAALLGETKQAAQIVDPAPVAAELESRRQAIAAAIALLPAGAVRQDFEQMLQSLTIDQRTLAVVVAGRQRVLGALDQATAAAETLARTGFSEALEISGRLRATVQPFSGIGEVVTAMLRRFGLDGVSGGLRGLLRGLLAVASPARIAGLLVPLLSALRGRAEALLDAFVAPLRRGINEVERLVASVDLGPLQDGLQAIVDEVKANVMALHPDALLGEVVQAFTQAQADLLAFDPLAPVKQVLETLQETAARVLERLDAHRLLEGPTRIWGEVMGALEALDAEALAKPLLDVLDEMAGRVDGGLKRTAESFERLQAALPG